MEILSTIKEARALDAKRFVADEVNLSRLPFFASAIKGLRKKVSIRYAYTKRIRGLEVEAFWEVSANAKYGYPGPFAEAVHTAISQIITERGLPVQNPVVFTYYDICKRLGIKYNTRNRRDIRKAIGSIRGALIETEHVFVDKKGNEVELGDTPEHLYKRVAFYGHKDRTTGETYVYSAVWLADFYLTSINKGYIRPLDFEYFKTIRKASYASTKLYRYLGYRFSGCFRYNNQYVKVDYDELAIIADVKRQPNLSLAKQKLEKAHTVLLETDFLGQEPVWQVEEQKGGSRPKLFILYYPGKRAREEYKRAYWLLTKQLELNLETDREKPDLANELIRLGVSENRAVRIAKAYTPEQINLQLDHLEYLGETGKQPDNVGGWLGDAIEKHYIPPTGFKTREERGAQRKAQTEAEEKHRQLEARQQQAEQERIARYKELDSRLITLPEEEQQRINDQIEERIRAGFDDFMRRRYATRPPDLKSPIHRGEYYHHLADLLHDREHTR